MASLNTLRTKGGVIVTVVIFVALLAFLVGDIFSSGSTLFNARKMRVGEINGKNISYVDFYKEADYMGNIYKVMRGSDAVSSQEQEMIYDMTWEQFMMRDSYLPGFQKLGLAVQQAEQLDMVDGVYLSPVITSMFVNPSTGEFDAEMMKYFMGNVNTQDGSAALWNHIRSQMGQERLMSKYLALVGGGFYANDLEIAHAVRTADDTFTARVVGRDYYTVADSTVTITDAQIRKYYDEHKHAYRQDEYRDVEYVVFDVLPSEADYAAAKEYVDGLAVEFASSSVPPMQYATLNSQEKPDTRYYREDELPAEIAALAFGADRYGMVGPTLNGDVYTMSRVADVRVIPDTLGARHILLAPSQRELADSLLGAIRAGADFAALAAEHSLDGNVVRNGGDLGRFTPDMLPEEFAEAAFAAKTGDTYIVESQAGIQVVELTYKSTPVRKAQIATVTYKVDPSAETIQGVYQNASAFVKAAAGTADGFRQAVSDEALSKRTVRIRSNERTVSGVENSKEIVRWAFNGKEGEVSQIMDVDGDYYVAALTDVRHAGFAPLASVSAQIEQQLRNEAKASLIAESMTGSTIEEVAAAAGEEIQDVEALQWGAFYIPGIGVEPKLIGAVTALPVGELSAPIEGVSGVYRVVVTDIQNAGTATPESERTKLDSNAQFYMAQRALQALTEESDVEDMRVKFF